jgi:hypothetical protein
MADFRNIVGQDIFTVAATHAEIRSAMGDVSEQAQEAIDRAVDQALEQAQTKIEEKVGEITSFETRLVSTLPSVEEAETNTLYFVPQDPSDPNNHKHWEYIFIDGRWELIGDTEFDISNYLTKAEASETYTTKENVTDFIKPATKTALGGVKVDDESIQLDADGLISVNSITTGQINNLFN